MKHLTIGVPVTPSTTLLRAISYMLVITSSSLLVGLVFDDMAPENEALRLLPTISFAFAYFFIFITGHTHKADEKFYTWSRPAAAVAAVAGHMYVLNLYASFNEISLMSHTLIAVALNLPLLIIFGLTVGVRA